MKASVYYKYGSPDVLKLEEVEKPTPKDDEVLIKVYAAAVNAADWHLLRGKPFLVRLMGFGLLKPKHKILGADVAGRVEAVGRNVKQFQPGDEVFGSCISDPQDDGLQRATLYSFQRRLGTRKHCVEQSLNERNIPYDATKGSQ